MPSKNLHVLMTADTKDVEQKVGRTEAAFQKMMASTAGLRSSLGAIVGGADPLDILKGQALNLIGSIPKIGPALESSFHGVESFWNKLRATQKDAAEQGKHALGLGATVEGYSALRFAVSDVDALDKGLHHLNVSTVEAAAGGGDVAASFERLGLDVQQLLQMPAEQKFLAFAEALRRVENSAVRSHVAQKVLGKGALALMGDLMKGREGLEKWMKYGTEQGKIVTKEDVANARLLDAELKKIDADLDEVWRAAARAFGPAILGGAQDLQKLLAGEGKEGGMRKSQETISELKHVATDAVGELDKLKKSLDVFFSTGSFRKSFFELAGPSAKTQAQKEVADYEATMVQALKKLKEAEEQSLIKLNERLKKEKEAADLKREQAEIERIQSQVKESSLTDLDKFNIKIANINASAMDGVLTWDQYYGALGNVVREFEKLERIKNEYRATEALEYGSAAEFSARQRAEYERRQPTSTENRVEDLLRQLRDHAKDTKKASQEMAEALKKLGIAKF